MKAMFKKYYAPTPTRWRKIGDALLVVGTTLTTTAIGNHNDTMAYLSLFAMVLGKFLTNAFGDIPETETETGKQQSQADNSSNPDKPRGGG